MTLKKSHVCSYHPSFNPSFNLRDEIEFTSVLIQFVFIVHCITSSIHVVFTSCKVSRSYSVCYVPLCYNKVVSNLRKY